MQLKVASPLPGTFVIFIGKRKPIFLRNQQAGYKDLMDMHSLILCLGRLEGACGGKVMYSHQDVRCLCTFLYVTGTWQCRAWHGQSVREKSLPPAVVLTGASLWDTQVWSMRLTHDMATHNIRGQLVGSSGLRFHRSSSGYTQPRC